MPGLGALVSALFVGLIDFFVTFVGRKLSVVLSSITMLGIVTAALLATFNALIVPLAAKAFSTEVGQFLGLAFPPVAGDCMAVMAAIWAACTLYAWQVKAIDYGVGS
jgi:hypothetical protein